jgi:CRP-like cAMP-binding protein
MSNALSEAENQQVVVGQISGLGRLARFLLYLADRQPVTSRNEKIVVPLPMNLRDISDHLYLRLETVSRFFADLTDRHIISRPNPHNVILLRRHALEKIH